MKPFSVSELNNQIKTLLESHFVEVAVEGEVSKVVYHSSGHLYFTLKDENSAIDCAMWRSNVAKLKFTLKPGERVVVFGNIGVYTVRGEYRVIAKSIEPFGLGALQKAYEELKKELAALGYFDESRKKSIPKFPKKVAIITSVTGAAIQDMLRIAKNRWGLSKFYLINALVQGEEAAEDIARKISIADEMGFDVIVVGRGGGSIEDLWAFNERVVADAIYNAKTPIISAVGHEIDYLISDFVADKRASTPSNAMEILLPDKNEILFFLDEKQKELENSIKKVFHNKEMVLNSLKELLISRSPKEKIKFFSKYTEELQKELNYKIERIFSNKRRELESVKSHFISLSPLNKIYSTKKEIEFLSSSLRNKTKSILLQKEQELNSLKKIYSSFKPQKEFELIKDNKKIKLTDLKVGDEFEIYSLKRVIKAEVKEIKE